MATISCNCSNDINRDREKRRRIKNSEFFGNGHVSLTMLCFALFGVILLVGASAESSVQNSSTSTQRKLIINGDSVAPSNHQFFVRSWPDNVKETNDVLCGATLIHSDIIITAAHCHGGFNYGAMLYDPDLEIFNQYRPVDLQIAYPKYYQNVKIINYDIMIIRLASPITNFEPISINIDPNFPIKINKNYNDNDADEIYLLEGLGVGLTETGFISRGLEVGYFNAIGTDMCAQRLGKTNVAMTDDIMCADPSTDDSICSGDSGGPLTGWINAAPNENDAVSRWSDTLKPVLVGVTSFGNDCKVDDVPDGFARISYFHKWIDKQICKYSRDAPVECFDYFQSEEYLEFVAEQSTPKIIWANKARITMKFQHDFLAEQTVFVFRDLKTNEIEYVGPQYVPQRGEFVASNFLLPVPGNYAIEIHDTGDNGLTNPRFVDSNVPQGSWSISAEYSNGARLEDLATGDFAFESLQTRFIKLPRRLADPFIDPTQSMAPTVTPRLTITTDTGSETQLVSSSFRSISSTWALAILSLAWTAFL